MRTGLKDDPNTESMETKFNNDLTDVNVPIAFEMPPSCK
jgi:hypothetical protein